MLRGFQRFDPLVFVLLRELPQIKRLLHAQPDLRPIALFGLPLVGAGASLESSTDPDDLRHPAGRGCVGPFQYAGPECLWFPFFGRGAQGLCAGSF